MRRYLLRPPSGRLVSAGLAALVMLLLLLSPVGSGAEPRYRAPPLSSTALLSRFAREQGIVPASYVEDIVLGDAPAAHAAAAEAVPLAVGGVDIKVNQDFSLRAQNETTIAVNPASPNMIVAGANDYRLGAPIAAAFYTSFDNGFSWSDGVPPYPLFVVNTGAHQRLVEPPFGTGDPVVAFGRARPGNFELPGGTPTAYYAYLGVSANFCEHGIFVSRSTDGLLWTRPVVPPLLPPGGLFTPVFWDRPENCGVFNDKPWLAVDTSGGPHDGRVYVTWSRFVFANKKFKESVILLSYSDDNAATWSAPIEVSGASAALCAEQVSGPAPRCDESHFSSLAVGKDGTAYVAFINQQFAGARDGFRNQYLVSKLDPDSLALSGPYRVAGLVDGETDLPLNVLGQPTICNSNFRFNSFGNLAIDPSAADGKTLYLVFADNRNGSQFPRGTRVTQEPVDSFACPEDTTTDIDVFVLKSVDGGVTWRNPSTGSDEPLRVNKDPPHNGRDQWFPFAAVAPDGRVDIVFHDRRDDFFNRFTHVYLARSSDGGATWSETRVTDFPSNMNWAFESGLFMGDYNGIAIGPDGTSYPFWTDARRGTPRIRQSDVMMDTIRK